MNAVDVSLAAHPKPSSVGHQGCGLPCRIVRIFELTHHEQRRRHDMREAFPRAPVPIGHGFPPVDELLGVGSPDPFLHPLRNSLRLLVVKVDDQLLPSMLTELRTSNGTVGWSRRERAR